MLDSGLIELGTHTHTHQRFVGRIDAFREDMQASIELLHEQFGVRRPTFAFPHGLHDQPMLDVARDLGIRCAPTTTPGLIDISSDPLGWGRFSVESHDTAATLAGKLGGWYTPLTHKLRSLGRSTIGRKSAAPLSGPPAPTHRCRRPPRWNRRPKKRWWAATEIARPAASQTINDSGISSSLIMRVDVAESPNVLSVVDARDTVAIGALLGTYPR